MNVRTVCAPLNSGVCVAFFILAAFLSGCEGPDDGGSRAAPLTANAAGGESPAAAPRKTPAAPQPPPPPAATADFAASVTRSLEVREALSRPARAVIDREVRNHQTFARVLRAAYGANEGRLFFHHRGGPSEEIEALLAILRRAPEEGLPPEPYHMETIERLVAQQRALLVETDALRNCEGLSGTQSQLCRLALSMDAPLSLDEAARTLRQEGFATLDPRLVPFVDEHLGHLLARGEILAGVQAQLDIYLLRGFFQFVLDYKLVKRAHPDLVTAKPDEAPVRFRERLVTELGSADGQFAAHLAALRPQHPLYDRTAAALAHYRALAASGEFKPLQRQRLQPGKSAPAVRELKKRLALENFFQGTTDDHFGDDLRDAVERYQTMRTLNVDGLPGRQLYDSLNIPIERRLRALELSLQRWRESDIPPGLDFYARINIPQYEVEFWSGDKLLRTHIVIVGNNSHARNLGAGLEGRLNHTRLFNSEMNTIVLNPTWAVPARIKKYDLDRELEKNPNFYEEQGFELVELSGGRSYLRQGPGPNNALGRVKFLFPNEYSIYMHDTPRQHLFRRTHRAFSYGCVRTHDPISLAKWLLESRNGMTEAEVDAILQRNRERAITVRTPVPVFIEYNTTTVDAEGRVGFFDDIYGYDRAYWAGELPFERARPIPTARLTKLREDEASWRADLDARLSDPEGLGSERITDEEAGQPAEPAPSTPRKEDP